MNPPDSAVSERDAQYWMDRWERTADRSDRDWHWANHLQEQVRDLEAVRVMQADLLDRWEARGAAQQQRIAELEHIISRDMSYYLTVVGEGWSRRLIHGTKDAIELVEALKARAAPGDVS